MKCISVDVAIGAGITGDQTLHRLDSLLRHGSYYEEKQATDESIWCTPQSWRNRRVATEVNSGPPFDASSSGIPEITKVRRRQSIRSLAPTEAFSTIGQLE